MREVIERDFTKNLAEPFLTEDEAENGYQKAIQENNVTKVSKEQDVKYEEQECANLKKFADESTSERDSTNAEFSAMVQHNTKLNNIRVVKEKTHEEKMRRRTADTAGSKEALASISEKYRKINGSLDVLEFQHAVIFVTFVKYVQKTTSPIRLDFKAVTTLSKIVCLDSEICFGSNLNSATKCLGFCETRMQVSFETVSCVIVEYFCLLNLVFGYATVLMMNIINDNHQDLSLNVSQDASQDVWQNQASH